MGKASKIHRQKVAKRKVIRKDVKDIPIVIGAFGASEGCAGIVEKVDTLPEGGVFTKYIGCNYFFKGYPDVRIIEYIYASKRIMAGLFKLISNKPIKFLLGITFLFYLILPRQMKKKVIIGLLDYILGISHWIEYKNPYPLPTEAYSPTAKEIHRVLEILLQDIEDIDIRSRIQRLKDIPLMTIEMDTAYRFRFQDIIPEFNKTKLKENPKKEINRVLDIFIYREAVDGDNDMTTKWKGLKKVVILAWRFKKLRNIILKFLLEIDIDKIKPDEADWYFMLDRNDYLYGGVSYEERMKISKELDKKMGNKRPEIQFQQKNNQQ